MIVPHEELSNTNKRLSSELYESEIAVLKVENKSLVKACLQGHNIIDELRKKLDSQYNLYNEHEFIYDQLKMANEELQEKLSDATLKIGILSGEPSG